MLFSLPALGAIFSLLTFPAALQTGTALDEQRAEVFHEEPRAEVDALADKASNDVETKLPVERVELEPVTVEDVGEVVALNDGDDPLPTPVEDSVAADVQPSIAPVVEDPTLVDGEAQQALLTEVSAALSAVTTAKGRFVQIAPDGSESTGDFYLRRPGRVRFEYDAPVPLLIVADGATVAVEDKDLETQDRVPLGTTPLGLLLDDDLDFEEDAEILSVRRANGYVAVALRDRSGETEGTLEIVLTDGPLDLVAWQTIDSAGGITGVQLNDVETGIRISPRLFRIEELDEDQGRD
ncbi:MAG: outer membrane lipoprotein carrier protein LolA [Pseudomonadota bacterium]